MDATPPVFQKVLDVLIDDDKDIPRSYLMEFSDIDANSLQMLLEIWPRVPLSRKLFLLDKLNILVDKHTLVSFDDLGRALLTDPNSEVRIRAMGLLVECEDHRLIPAYIEILTDDQDVSARAKAASMLGSFVQLGEFDSIPDEAQKQVEETLLKVFHSEDDSLVRRHALEALGYSSREEIPTLIDSSFNRQDPDWKASALFAMGRSGDERWEDHVLHMLLAEHKHLQAAALHAAGELGLASARPLLLRMLMEEELDDIVASTAIWALSQIGGEDTRIYLESLLDKAQDDEEIAFLEEALDNLAFTDDIASFDLMAFDEASLDDFPLED